MACGSAGLPSGPRLPEHRFVQPTAKCPDGALVPIECDGWDRGSHGSSSCGGRPQELGCTFVSTLRDRDFPHPLEQSRQGQASAPAEPHGVYEMVLCRSRVIPVEGDRGEPEVGFGLEVPGPCSDAHGERLLELLMRRSGTAFGVLQLADREHRLDHIEPRPSLEVE